MPDLALAALLQGQIRFNACRGDVMKNIRKTTWSGVCRAILLAGSTAVGLWPAVSLAAAPVETSLGAYGQTLRAPARLAADASGNLYVVEPRDGRIVVYDAFGRVASIKAGLAGPLGVAVDTAGRVYLAEQGAGSVSVFDSQWNLLYKLGVGNGEFGLPNYVALDPARPGVVYVTDSSANEVRAYQDDRLLLRFSGDGTNALNFPAGVYLSAAGELFVVDQNNDRVQVFSAAGVYLRQFTLVTKVGSGMFGSYAGGRSQGVLGDALGRIYVADSYQGFVRVFDSQGVYLGNVGAFGENPGQLRLPAGLALDPFNRLFVASVNNGRVEIFGLDAYLHFQATPAVNSVAEGASITLSVIAGGSGPFTWQWMKDGLNLADGAKVSGSASPTLTLAGLASGDSGSYAVAVNGTVVSPGAVLTVLRPPVITQGPADLALVAGSDAVFSVVADGALPLAYQWQKGGRVLDGETSSTLGLLQVQDFNAGVYTVMISNLVGSATASAALTITHPPVVTDFSAKTTVNATLPITTAQLLAGASSPDQSPLTVSAATSPSAQGGTVVLSADAVTYTPPQGFIGGDSFGYTVTDANGNSANASVLVTVTVPAPRMRQVALITEGAQLSFEGVPGQTYSLERRDGGDAPAWTRIGQATVGADGVGTFLDPTNLTAGAWYRAAYP
jgi:sugar lactone lactonase YvrE